MSPKHKNNQSPVQQHHQEQNNVDGDQIEEDWDGKHQKQLQQNTKSIQAQDAQQQKNSLQIQNA